MVVVLAQPVDSVYEIVAVPADAPLTSPVVAVTVATLVGVEDHRPPLPPSVNRVVAPAHIDSDPPAGTAGNGFTVTTVVLLQPVAGVV
jgi:hypothetical protein